MASIEERILAYPHLPPEEQQEVEARVQERAEWQPLLQDVKALDRLASDARHLAARSEDREVLATYVLAQRLYPDAIPDALRRAFDRLEERLASDADLRERLDAVRAELDDLEASLDPVSHFESVTGRTLDAISQDAVSQDAALQDGALQDATSQDASSSSAPTYDAPTTQDATVPEAEAPSTWLDRLLLRAFPAPVRGAVAVVVGLAVAYGALFAASRAAQSPTDRLAAVEISESMLESYQIRTRSATPAPAPAESLAADSLTADKLYVRALRQLQTAQRSTLGLFPRYDQQALTEAKRLLTRVIERVEPGSFLQLEALFYLGKVHLAHGEIAPARDAFKTVVQQSGRRSEQAYAILQELQQVAPARPNIPPGSSPG